MQCKTPIHIQSKSTGVFNKWQLVFQDTNRENVSIWRTPLLEGNRTSLLWRGFSCFLFFRDVVFGKHTGWLAKRDSTSHCLTLWRRTQNHLLKLWTFTTQVNLSLFETVSSPGFIYWYHFNLSHIWQKTGKFNLTKLRRMLISPSPQNCSWVVADWAVFLYHVKSGVIVELLTLFFFSSVSISILAPQYADSGVV